jgi:cytochrome d ubiquinol oxidase subunit II
MFSGFYVALVLMLLMLILRGVAFEFRSKDAAPRWRRFWDGALVLGSAVPALLWGVAMANLILGVPIDEGMNFAGTFFSLLSPLALLCGVVSFVGFTLLGAVFLCLRTSDDLAERAHAAASRLWLPVVLLVALALLLGFTAAGVAVHAGVLPVVTAIAAVAALLASGALLRRRAHGGSFAAISLSVAFLLLTLFLGLYPRVMVSSLNEAWSLTVYTASSSPYTLRVMTIITLTLLPFVLAYQAWSYRVFRKRIGAGSHLEY